MTPITLRISWTFGLISPPIPDPMICCSWALQNRGSVKVKPGWITVALNVVMVALSCLLQKSAAKERFGKAHKGSLMESSGKGHL